MVLHFAGTVVTAPQNWWLKVTEIFLSVLEAGSSKPGCGGCGSFEERVHPPHLPPTPPAGPLPCLSSPLSSEDTCQGLPCLGRPLLRPSLHALCKDPISKQGLVPRPGDSGWTLPLGPAFSPCTHWAEGQAPLPTRNTFWTVFVPIPVFSPYFLS